jgi:8-oxo-dGTP diphosphatase
MNLKKKQRLSIVARGLIFRQDHLLVTQWKDSYAFPIGGRVEHGEPLHEAVIREVKEETGATARIKQLVYFAEHMWNDKDAKWHEYNWFYWVETDDEICPVDGRIPNPDHPDLTICWLPITEINEITFYPRFCQHYLPDDYRQGFCSAPRHLLDDDRPEPPLLREIMYGVAP